MQSTFFSYNVVHNKVHCRKIEGEKNTRNILLCKLHLPNVHPTDSLKEMKKGTEIFYLCIIFFPFTLVFNGASTYYKLSLHKSIANIMQKQRHCEKEKKKMMMMMNKRKACFLPFGKTLHYRSKVVMVLQPNFSVTRACLYFGYIK